MDQHKKKRCALVAVKDIMHSFCFDVKVNLGNIRNQADATTVMQ